MSLSITSQLIIAAAEKRGWKTTVLHEAYSLYTLTLPDGRILYMHNITSFKNKTINNFLAAKKDVFYDLVTSIGIRVPKTVNAQLSEAELKTFLKNLGRVVVKPSDQGHGNGITVNVSTYEKLVEAIRYAREFSQTVLVQEQIVGADYRLLYIDYKLAAAAIRKPAYVTGDGIHTLSQLIAIENDKPIRKAGYSAMLTTIDAHQAERYLGASAERIPTKGSEVQVVGVANIGQGGIAIDVTDELDARLTQIADTVTKHFGMEVCGVDLMVDKNGPCLLEVNVAPSLGLHEHPFKGSARQTPDLFLDWLAK